MSWLVWVGLFLLLVFGVPAFIGAPYLPSRRRDLKIAFDELYKLNADDLLIDIGSGDGVVLRAAARRGARAIGYEINPILVWIAKWLERKLPLAETRLANFWQIKTPKETTVFYLFGDGRDIKRLEKWLVAQASRLQKNLHVISYGFELPGQKLIRTHGAHHLYQVSPLQSQKAQV